MSRVIVDSGFQVSMKQHISSPSIRDDIVGRQRNVAHT